jgi:adenine-specific DNA-methyltransferase
MFRNVKHNHEEQTVHPCQFPEDMITRIVLATTGAGDVVMDPYMGTGTVAIVARDHDRTFVGAETDDDYHRTALQRIAGEPDAGGVFPNLKTLRDFCERSGEPHDRYRFAVQVGDAVSSRKNAKIFPEAHHLEELEKRLDYEEACFAADLRGEERPEDHFKGGKVKDDGQAGLF